MRWLLAAVVLVGLAVLAVIAASPALHSPGEDCSALDENSSEPSHGTHESEMYAETNGTTAGCPIDDGAEMSDRKTATPI
jgi:hypothetical protein